MFSTLSKVLSFGNLSLRYEAASKNFIWTNKSEPSKTLKMKVEEIKELAIDSSLLADKVAEVEEALAGLQLNLEPESGK